MQRKRPFFKRLKITSTNIEKYIDKLIDKSKQTFIIDTKLLSDGDCMLIGYMRVSKNDGSQLFDLQRDALVQAGVAVERIYQDRTSGKKECRPGLDACLKALQPGNTLLVWKLDRLGRDLKHLVTTIEDLRNRSVDFKVLTGAGAQIDTTTANGKMCFGLFAVLAEFERELIIERTKAGLMAARARGRMGGRPRKMDKATLSMAMAAMSDRSSVAKDVAKRLGLTTATLYAYVNGDGTLKKPGEELIDGKKISLVVGSNNVS
jgi:DNA invertase Pin-like site-specific DNA recombinase